MRMKMGVAAVLCATILATAHADELPEPTKSPDLGINASLHGKPVFPADDPWNRDISKDPVDEKSAAIIARIGARLSLHPDFGTVYNGAPSGIPYVIIDHTTKTFPVSIGEYADESDKGPYPIPADAPVEGGLASDGDRHVLIIDRDAWKLYELWHATPLEGGAKWQAACGAIFDLKNGTTRPAGWTSADAAGLPIFPGLVRYDEVVDRGEITHAIRFTVVHSRHAYVAPARHFASSLKDTDLPPMGMRVRLKADYDISKFPPADRVILTALKRYGMILADNGGNWFLSGAPDPRWDDDALHRLSKIHGSDFEVIKMGDMTTR